MESLPVELVRIVFQYCDLPSVKTLRLMNGVFADVGYDYLVPSEFNVVGWRDDITRLHSIASHDRMKSSIESITINFAEVDEYNARHASYFNNFAQDPEERSDLLANAWVQYYEADKRRKALPAFDSRPALIQDAFKSLPNLKDLQVTFTKCPFDIEILGQVFEGLPNCRKMDRAQAIKNLALIASALKGAKLESFSVDRFPLEIFRLPDDRRHWVDCVSTPFANLTNLSLTIDPSNILFPAARLKAIRGLGTVLRYAPNLTHLSLAFHTYGAPKHKFILWFDNLLQDFTFEKLTDLKLEGISCDEEDLRHFLLRHASTLERIRLGGRGLAKAHEEGLGGIHMCRGTFRSLFYSLRNKLPKLERVHMEGDFESVGVEGSSNESYSFHGVTDENWEEVVNPRDPLTQGKTRDCLDFERYLIQGGSYPSAHLAVAAQ